MTKRQPLAVEPPEFLDLTPVFSSYSANFEDVILHRLFADQASGFYVDVGAGHPWHENDTMALYARGWSGINIEPNPHFHALLTEHRRRDLCYRVAAAEHGGSVTYYEIVGTGLSTCEPAYAARAQKAGHKIITHEIATRTLEDIFSEAAPPKIDLLKVDVEGWEELVLSGNDWDRFRPSLILIEATWPNTPQRRPTGIRGYLEGRGYRHAYFDGLNDFYVAQSFKFPANALSVPPNVFDRFELHRIVELQKALRSCKLDIADFEAEHYALTAAVKKMRLELVSASVELEDVYKDRERLLHYQRPTPIGLKGLAIALIRRAVKAARKPLRYLRRRLAAF